MLEHGEYQLERHGQIIVLSCIGAWNDYTARKMSADFLLLANEICDEPWGTLTDATAWELGPPDIWPPIEKLKLWSNSRNQTLDAIVTNSRLHKILFTRAHESLTHAQTRHFSNTNDALAWLVKNNLDAGELLNNGKFSSHSSS